MNNYEKVLSLKVFNNEDIFKLTNNLNTSYSMLRNLLLSEKIKKVKKDLYTVCDIESKNVIADQYMIASKIKEDSYVCYHSALEYYGIKNQVFYDVYVSSKKRFTNFEFDGYYYNYIKSRHDFGILKSDSVRVTDKERTFIDCINKTELAGGNEELIICLELIGKLKGNKILEYLKYYNSKKLYAKVGFMLELLNDVVGVEKDIIEKCKENINDKRYYFNKETQKSDNKYFSDWNLIVPKIFLTRGELLHW